ncbi:hypothetical protein [Ciceribacter ferrooxidans]|nr:hypothetical protein [Ciceribacter ferrooxidans]
MAPARNHNDAVTGSAGHCIDEQELSGAVDAGHPATLEGTGTE